MEIKEYILTSYKEMLKTLGIIGEVTAKETPKQIKLNIKLNKTNFYKFSRVLEDYNTKFNLCQKTLTATINIKINNNI